MTGGGTGSAVARVTAAREQFHQLTGLEPEKVSGMTRVDGGWSSRSTWWNCGGCLTRRASLRRTA